MRKPLGEARADQEIGELLIAGVGKDPKLAYGKTEDQQLYEKIAGCKVMGDDAKMKTLVTLTADDIKGLNAEGAGPGPPVDNPFGPALTVKPAGAEAPVTVHLGLRCVDKPRTVKATFPKGLGASNATVAME